MSLRERIALFDWRILWLVLLVGLLIAALSWWNSGDRAPNLSECTRLYDAAHSMADTTIVDETIPLVTNPKFREEGVKCGVLRQLGKVPLRQ